MTPIATGCAILGAATRHALSVSSDWTPGERRLLIRVLCADWARRYR